jgi:hypothetical protein
MYVSTGWPDENIGPFDEIVGPFLGVRYGSLAELNDTPKAPV